MSCQAYIFFIFILNGFIIGIVFDMFRIIRKSFKTNNFFTNLEDILFCIISGFILIYSIFKFNNGELRFYIFIGTIIGSIIYLLLFSKIFINISVLTISYLRKITRVVIYIPIKKTILALRKIIIVLKRIINKPVSFVVINIRKMLSKIKIKSKKTKYKHNKNKKNNKNSKKK